MSAAAVQDLPSPHRMMERVAKPGEGSGLFMVAIRSNLGVTAAPEHHHSDRTYAVRS